MNRIIFSLTIAAAVLAFGAAQAMPSADETIRVAVNTTGLDMHTAAGVRDFGVRVKAAATTVCMESRGIDDTMAAERLLETCVRQSVKAAMVATDHKN